MKINELDKYIQALKQCAREHEKDFIPTFNINTFNLCDDTAKLLEEIKEDLKKLGKFILETRYILWEIRFSGGKPVKNTSRKDVYNALEKLQNKYNTNTLISNDWFLLRILEGEQK